MGVGGGGVNFSVEKRYEGVRFNVISVTRGCVGVQIPGKKRYVTLEWPLTSKDGTVFSVLQARVHEHISPLLGEHLGIVNIFLGPVTVHYREVSLYTFHLLDTIHQTKNT